jgi:hypothetical protein
MPLDRRFVKASITELLPAVWQVEVVFSYFSIYEFVETHVENNMIGAIRWLLKKRCGDDKLRITNAEGLNI